MTRTILSIALVSLALTACGQKGRGPAIASPVAAATGTALPTAPPVENLLAPQNGTVLWRYPASVDGQFLADAVDRFATPAGNGPFTYVFELPGPAQFSQFAIAIPGAEPATVVDLGLSSQTADSGFAELGSVTGSDQTDTQFLQSGGSGRWLQITTTGRIANISATGTIEAPPAGVVPNGLYIEEDAPFAGGSFVPTGVRSDHWYARFVALENGLDAVECFDGRYGATFVGSLEGRTWTATGDGNAYRGAMNDEGSLVTLTFTDGSSPRYFLKIDGAGPPACSPIKSGNGSRHLLVLDSEKSFGPYPDRDAQKDRYSVTRIAAGMLDAAALDDQDDALARGVCNANAYWNAPQQQLLLKWVAAGHELSISDTSGCSGGVDLSWLPSELHAPSSQSARSDWCAPYGSGKICTRKVAGAGD